MQPFVIFDVFGTLIRIESRRDPYLHLLRYGRTQGVSPSREQIEMLMTCELDWSEAADALGIRAGYVKLHGLARLLEEEVATMTLYEDAQKALELLQGAGIKIALCTNLASAYGPTVRALLPGLDGYAFSYELGVMKPSPVIYRAACRDLGGQPGQQMWGDRVVMIGDSIRCDRDGPRSVGIAGFYLGRKGGGDFDDLIEFAECVLKG